MKKVISVFVIAGALLALGSDKNQIQQTLVGDRVLGVSTSATNSLVVIDGKQLVEIRTPTSNSVTIVVFGGRGESLAISFKDGESEPYSLHRTIRGETGSTAIIYGTDGSIASQAFIPKRTVP